MSKQFKVPELGEGVESAEVSQMYVSEGDTIEADQPVLELETEKAVTDLPCPHAGKITKTHVSKGDTIEVGQTILTIETEEAPEEKKSGKTKRQKKKKADDEDKQQAKKQDQTGEEEQSEKKKKAPKEEQASKEEQADKEEQREKKEGADQEEPPEEDKQAAKDRQAEKEEKTRAEGQAAGSGDEDDDEGHAEDDAEDEDEDDQLPPPAGPATRRLARKLDVDLDETQGSGPRGRITQEDVVQEHDRAKAPSAPGGMSQPALPDFSKFGPVERQPLNKIARTASKRLSMSWATVPHVTQHDLADITQLEAARRRYLEDRGKSDPKITLTAITVKAVTTVLKEFPLANSSLDAEREELILKNYYHIGVAVDTENGLLVPVIRDADQKTILDLAVELSELAERARGRKLGAEDMEGGTFTISNQGGIGGTAFTPIVSFPQVAILGMSRARTEVQLNDGQPESRLMLPLSLSYDHRVLNGADAARFLVRLSTELSDSFQFLIRT